MPYRKVVFSNHEIYHIFNRGINRQPIFFVKRDYVRNLQTLEYYSSPPSNLRFSKFKLLSLEQKANLLSLKANLKNVNILCYCLMPNHFHLLIQQSQDNGITQLMRKYQSSYTKYLNNKYDRDGPILRGRFKAVRIETDEQLIHVSRYIHLNPYTSLEIKNLDELLLYPWSSFKEYMNPRLNSFIQKDLILAFFASNPEKYISFILNQAEYQRKLESIKHLVLE